MLFRMKRVEIIEGADDAVGDLAAFFHVRVDVGKMPVIRGQGGFSVHGDTMQRAGSNGAAKQRKGKRENNPEHAQILSGKRHDWAKDYHARQEIEHSHAEIFRPIQKLPEILDIWITSM